MKLSHEQRQWLGDPGKARWLMKDVILGFALTFDLTPCEAGILMAQWVRTLDPIPGHPAPSIHHHDEERVNGPFRTEPV